MVIIREKTFKVKVKGRLFAVDVIKRYTDNKKVILITFTYEGKKAFITQLFINFISTVGKVFT